MDFKVLDQKYEAQSSCFLVSATLEEYVQSIPPDYDDYEIQRSIVNNFYLDRLVHTVLRKGHIPSITLITSDRADVIREGSISDFKILDGLQRTHRLKIIFETKELLLNHVVELPDGLNEFQVKRHFREELSKIGSSGNLLVAIRDFYLRHGKEELNSCFSDNAQWFEIWSGLAAEDEVKKMLVLNAGQKPVNIKHQLELIFQNIYPIFEDVKSGNISIVREKEMSSTTFSKNRGVGSYHFTHLISALISFFEARPVTTNTGFIAKVQDDDRKLKEFTELFSYSFLEEFLASVYKLDLAARDSYHEIGLQWFGREVSLVSLFGAIGARTRRNNEELSEVVDQLTSNFDKCNLEEYEECRNGIDLAKVNIGNINKKNIYEAFKGFFSDDMAHRIDWPVIFAGER